MVTQWKTLKGRSKDSQPVPFQLFLPRRDLDLIMINAEEQRFIPIINSPIACSVSIIILGIILCSCNSTSYVHNALVTVIN